MADATGQRKMVPPGMIRKHMNGDGTVNVYDKDLRRWRKLYPIDAREQIASGSVLLEEPRHIVRGPAGQVVVADSEVASYEQRGYAVEVRNIQTSDASTAKLQAAANDASAASLSAGGGEPGPKNAGDEPDPEDLDDAASAKAAKRAARAEALDKEVMPVLVNRLAELGVAPEPSAKKAKLVAMILDAEFGKEG